MKTMMNAQPITHAPKQASAPWKQRLAVREREGAPYHYIVQSSTRDMQHTVDLTQRGGHGTCTCEHFRYTASRSFQQHGMYVPYAAGERQCSECKHIRAALEHFHLHVTMPLLESFGDGRDLTREVCG